MVLEPDQNKLDKLKTRAAHVRTIREKYGADHYREIGKKGGRPRLPTLTEILNKRLSEIEQKRKEIDPKGNTKSLPKMLKLLKLHQEEIEIKAQLKNIHQ